MDTNKTEELIIRRDVLGFIYSQTPLVRCKDCARRPICCRPPRNDPGWFCADGERQEDNGQTNRDAD